LSYGQNELISGLAKVQPNIVVVTFGGNAFATPWIDEVPAMLHCWYLGSMAGKAMTNILTGEVNPSGKLPVTFAKKLEDYPYYQYGEEAYPGVNGQVYYKEDIYVGYRWFNTKKIKPQFPFGFGLSYTTFEYGKPTVSAKTMTADGSVKVTTTVTNIGKRAGKEIVQLYIGDVKASEDRPLKELKDFKKISLEPGETKTVEFEITAEDLQYFSGKNHKWIAEPGKFKAYVCASETDVRGEVGFELK
jgi:beta-glucosidase